MLQLRTGYLLLTKNYYYTCEKQTSLKEYVRKVIEQTGATIEHLAREFHLDEQDVKKLVERKG